MDSLHHPVLLKETLQQLDLQRGDIVLDATIGYAGHSEAMLSLIGPSGFLIGIDQDQTAIKFCQKHFSGADNVALYNVNFSKAVSCLKDAGFPTVTKILIDLGMSSVQLDSQTRGFSFQYDAPLDMRMNQEASLKAVDILNQYSAEDLSDMFYHYGDLHQNKILVRHIIDARKQGINNTFDLIELIKKSYFFKNNRRKYIKTVSQVFQALRIEVNQELTVLNTFLSQLEQILAPEGNIAILSFHSLEDKMVKRFFKEKKSIFSPLNKQVIKASQDEIKVQSRSHSALLRSYQRVALS